MTLSFLSDVGFIINAILLLVFIVVMAIAVNGQARRAAQRKQKEKQPEKRSAVRRQRLLKPAPQVFACPSATKYEPRGSIQPTAFSSLEEVDGSGEEFVVGQCNER
jgi:hypothetical protein